MNKTMNTNVNQQLANDQTIQVKFLLGLLMQFNSSKTPDYSRMTDIVDKIVFYIYSNDNEMGDQMYDSLIKQIDIMKEISDLNSDFKDFIINAKVDLNILYGVYDCTEEIYDDRWDNEIDEGNDYTDECWDCIDM